MLLFIYNISQDLAYIKRFNTSHVTLYHGGTLNPWTAGTGFNTSHVTLYRKTVSHRKAKRHVSIHLMLLFIGNLTITFSDGDRFQYISCYSLSVQHSPHGLVQNLVSIHLMLLFINNALEDTITFSEFQYISCYSLSM